MLSDIESIARQAAGHMATEDMRAASVTLATFNEQLQQVIKPAL